MYQAKIIYQLWQEKTFNPALQAETTIIGFNFLKKWSENVQPGTLRKCYYRNFLGYLPCMLVFTSPIHLNLGSYPFQTFSTGISSKRYWKKCQCKTKGWNTGAHPWASPPVQLWPTSRSSPSWWLLYHPFDQHSNNGCTEFQSFCPTYFTSCSKSFANCNRIEYSWTRCF